MSKNNFGFSTRAIHAGQSPDTPSRAINTPIYLSSTYVQSSPGQFLDRYDYGRTANPTRTTLEDKLAAIEGGTYALAFASGLAASSTIMQLLKTGDHVIGSHDLYGGTYRLFEKVYRPFSLDFSYVDLASIDALKAAFKPNTKLVWIETPTNPLLYLADIAAVAAEAKKRNALVVVDNTFASPVLQQPLALGADIVIHSMSKYIGGHSDLIGGACILNSKEIFEKLQFLQNAVGAVASPMDSYLFSRSIKTLELRVMRQCEITEKIVEYLSGVPEITKIYYPGLKTHPQHELVKKQMKHAGAMFSFVFDEKKVSARTFLEKLEIFVTAESLGGVHSLAELPAIMTHATIPKSEREQRGITDGLVRISVGIEDAQDLIWDIEQAIKAAKL